MNKEIVQEIGYIDAGIISIRMLIKLIMERSQDNNPISDEHLEILIAEIITDVFAGGLERGVDLR